MSRPSQEPLESLDQIADPRHSALILVDLQNDHVADKGAKSRAGYDLSMMPGVLAASKELLVVARSTGVPVVYMQDSRLPGNRHISGPFVRSLASKRGLPTELDIVGTWGWQIADEVAPQERDVVLHKYRESGFVGTALDLILRSMGVRTLVFVGVVTQGCLEHTARDALLYDYYSVVVREGVGSHDQTLHDAALERMGRVLDVVSVREIQGRWTPVLKQDGIAPAAESNDRIK